MKDMSSNLFSNSLFLRKFFHYLLIGTSALILLFTTQMGVLGTTFQRGPQEVLAENPYENPEVPPEAPSCSAPQFAYNQCISCDTSEAINQDSCGDYSSGGTQYDPACNYLCPQQPAPQPPAPVAPACIKDSVVRVTHDAQNCLVNVHVREDCSEYFGGPYSCPQVTVPVAPPVQQPPVYNPPAYNPPVQQPPAYYTPPSYTPPSYNPPSYNPPVCSTMQPVSQQCISCNTMLVTLQDSCGHQSTRTESNSSCSYLCQVVTPPVELPTQPVQPQQPQQQQQQQQQQPAAPVTVTTGNTTQTQTQTNSQTVSQTVNVPAQGAPIIIQQPAAPAPQVVLASAPAAAAPAQVLGVKELPKTGLPLIAWSVLALIPTGFKLKKLGSVSKDMEDNPNFIWEDRKFRVQV